MSKLAILAVAASIAVATLLAADASPARALSCAQLSLDEQVEHADVVLVGNIASLGAPDGDWREHTVTAEVSVTRYVKGIGPESVFVRSGTMGWAGGWTEEHLGQEWVLFLTEPPEDSVTESSHAAGAGRPTAPGATSLSMS